MLRSTDEFLSALVHDPIHLSPSWKRVWTSYSVRAVVILSKSLISMSSKLTTSPCLMPNKQAHMCKYDDFHAWFTSRCSLNFISSSITIFEIFWQFFVLIKFVFSHFLLFSILVGERGGYNREREKEQERDGERSVQEREQERRNVGERGRERNRGVHSKNSGEQGYIMSTKSVCGTFFDINWSHFVASFYFCDVNSMLSLCNCFGSLINLTYYWL